MDKLISDRAQVEISGKVKDILQSLLIDDWQSEPHHQHQNFPERCYGTIKSRTNIVMNRSGAPAFAWLLCLMYVCFLVNHLATGSLDWQCPPFKLTGGMVDISILLLFYFWEEVYYSTLEHGFPSETMEKKGCFIGFGDSVGDAFTFKILTDDTKKIIYRSAI